MNYPLRQAQHRCIVADTRRRDFAEAFALALEAIGFAALLYLAAFIWSVV